MRHKLKKNLILSFLSIAVFLTACQNEEIGSANLPVDVTNAKKWFDTNKPNLQALQYTKAIDWNNAIVTENTKGKTIEIPLILTNNTTTNIEDDKSYKNYMRLLFIENKEGTYKVFDIVFTTKDTNFDNNNKEFNFYKVDPEYSGFLTLQNSNNKILFSGKFENGKLRAIPRKAKNQNTARWVCSYTVTVGNYTNCSNWYWVWDPYDPEWLLVQRGWTNMDDYNNTYGGGGSSTDSSVIDPCQASYMTTATSEESNYLSAKNSIINASSDGLEHSITLGINNATNQALQSPMNIGGVYRVATNTSLEGAFAALHNHPHNTPISAGDIYLAVILNEKSSTFTTSFVYTNGDTYAIVVNNLVAAQNFVHEYPADQLSGQNPEFPDFIFDQIDILKKTMGQSIDARTKAISFVLDKYKSGITLLKQDSNGKFIPYIIEESIKDGNKIYFEKQPCY